MIRTTKNQRERFAYALEQDEGKDHVRDGIGTLSEKTVHAVLKYYYEQDQSHHEIIIEKSVADIFTGSIVVEKVFNIPGIGRILMTSISNRDYPVVEAIIMMMALVVIVTNLCVDLIYRKIDPRITVE